jgi:hypothetical protein
MKIDNATKKHGILVFSGAAVVDLPFTAGNVLTGA